MASAAKMTFYEKESDMRNRASGFIVVLTIILSAFIWQGCTRNAQPTDEEIINAIDASGALSRADGSLTIIPPLKIVEKGKQQKDGSWPVRIKVTLTLRMPDGRTSQPTETTTSFSVFRAKNEAGKKVWMARLGS